MVCVLAWGHSLPGWGQGHPPLGCVSPSSQVAGSRLSPGWRCHPFAGGRASLVRTREGYIVQYSAPTVHPGESRDPV